MGDFQFMGQYTTEANLANNFLTTMGYDGASLSLPPVSWEKGGFLMNRNSFNRSSFIGDGTMFEQDLCRLNQFKVYFHNYPEAADKPTNEIFK